MQDLKITLVQSTQHWEDKTANFNHFSRLLEGCSTDLILLPEMFQTGFTMNAESNAEDFNRSESIQWLQELAANLHAAIYTSLIVSDGNSYFNRGVFIEPNGRVTSYDKRRLFSLAGEDKVYTGGENEVILEYLGWKINLAICYDLRFPELYRNRIEKSGKPAYDLLLFVANWPERRIAHWQTLLEARAIENQCYVAGVNRIGTDNHQLSYNGKSKLIDPWGDELIELNGEQCASVVINYTKLIEIREKIPFLKDR